MNFIGGKGVKKILFLILLVIISFEFSAEEIRETTSSAIGVEKTKKYPQQIIWEYEMFDMTNIVYSPKDIQVEKIGEYNGFEIYEEIGDSDSKFIKTDKGYLLYMKMNGILKKPNIYLYPVEKQEISVNLDFLGKVISSYPKYENGWKVIGNEKGDIVNISDNRDYSYLYWEGTYKTNWDMSKGFVVKGEDVAKFLQEKLEYMGLKPKEFNEFIVYWLPYMEKNKYNYISFVNEEYSKEVKLNVTPKPDKFIRVFMVFKPLNEKVNTVEQELVKTERTGFTVVEWGGMEVK